LDKEFIFNKLKGRLIVSCQALEQEPLHSSMIMGRMAVAAKEGGASGIRANSVEDIIEIRKKVDLPIIGIIKQNYDDSEIYITSTMTEIKKLVDCPAEIIAMDATLRKRPQNAQISEMIDYVKKSGKIAMADIATFEEGVNAQKLGFDIVSTTLSGYTPQSEKSETPAFELIEKLKNAINIPIIAEGHIKTPQELVKVIKCGAYCAVVGSIITRPQIITRYFVSALESIQN
jgi:N-acylglucosamine-6-phosphate 2-epimerase